MLIAKPFARCDRCRCEVATEFVGCLPLKWAVVDIDFLGVREGFSICLCPECQEPVFAAENARDFCRALCEPQQSIVETDTGKAHHPESVRLFKELAKLDFQGDDYFCWKSGGDGDNGEVLMDQLDTIFAQRAVVARRGR